MFVSVEVKLNTILFTDIGYLTETCFGKTRRTNLLRHTEVVVKDNVLCTFGICGNYGFFNKLNHLIVYSAVREVTCIGSGICVIVKRISAVVCKETDMSNLFTVFVFCVPELVLEESDLEVA